MSGVATAIGVGAAISYVSSENAANAQSGIANAQLGQQRNDRAAALHYAEATPEELAQIQKSVSLNEADITRKQKLLDSSDPALIEAGQQALKLLQGQDAKTLAPLRSQQAKQEQALRAKLQAQLGPGYENTTAGIQALQAFNEQSNNSLAAAQQSSLAQLLGTAQDTSSRYGMQSNISNAGSLAGLYGNINSRQVAALNGTPITASGAQFVGDLQSARGMQQTLGTALQAYGAFGANATNNSTTNNNLIGTNGYVQSASNTNPYAMNA